jgi:serine/threonine protein kinase
MRVSEDSLQGAAPPELPGYRFLSHIGSGGNAQVYLYEQELPSRKVAVKVLNDSALSDAARRRFTTEANVTAVLAHRHIVQVFDAKVTDDGQPYIVMPFYPQPNLSVRARRAHFSVAQVLRIGIQIGSAVETSHRHGVLHRDIKPQNILTDSYGEPALTDFGIATTTVGDGPVGLSVPWSPPEIIYGTGPGDQRSDVYSLGATLWHLLVGRPPFERPGGGNTTGQLMDRIYSDPPPRTQRADVPDSLERLLRQAMAKDQAARPQSAMELIRGLQSIEQELRLPVTHPILPADEPARGDTRGDTVARPAANGGGSASSREQGPAVTDSPRVDAGQPAGRQPGGPAEGAQGPGAGDADPMTRPDEPSPGQDEQSQPRESSDPRDETIARGGQPPAPWQPAAAPDEDTATRGRAPVRPRQFPAARPDAATVARSDAGQASGTESAGTDDVDAGDSDAGDSDAGRRQEGIRPRRVLAFAASGVLLAVVAAVAVAVLARGGESPGSAQAGAGQAAQQGSSGGALGPEATDPGQPAVTVRLANAKQVEFSWTYANRVPSDTFRWQESGGTGESAGLVKKPELLIPVARAKGACVTVTVFRADGDTASLPSDSVCWSK